MSRPDWVESREQMLASLVDDEFRQSMQRSGSCCSHSAIDHIWIKRNGVIYPTACCECECCFWREL